MGMLHPKFNHLGRSKKNKKRTSKEQLKADLEHARFLRSHGINPNRKRVFLKGAVSLPCDAISLRR